MTGMTLLQAAADSSIGIAKLGAALGASIAALAAAYGIGNIGKSALFSCDVDYAEYTQHIVRFLKLI